MIKKILKIFLWPLKKSLFFIVQNIKIKGPEKKIHIVRSDTIGDFVLFSAILPYFKKIYPDYKIVLIGDAVWQELALWLQEYRILEGRSNYFDELIAVNGKSYSRNLFYYYKILKKLRLSMPEIVIQPTFSRTQKSDGWVLISKEAQKIGYKSQLSNNKKYDRLIESPNSCLEFERNKHFLNELTGHELVLSGLPHWNLSEKLLSQGRDFLKLWGVDPLRPILMIFPSGSAKIRCWPNENFVSLILKLFQYDSSIQFVLIGGPRDKKICSQITKDKKISNLPIFNICGRTKLSELAKILSLARLYIGTETGAMHLASALGTSVVCLLGGGHYNRFFPYSAWKQGAKNIAVIHKMNCFKCNWRCPYIKKNESAPCVKNIKIEEVYNQVVKLLKK